MTTASSPPPEHGNGTPKRTTQSARVCPGYGAWRLKIVKPRNVFGVPDGHDGCCCCRCCRRASSNVHRIIRTVTRGRLRATHGIRKLYIITRRYRCVVYRARVQRQVPRFKAKTRGDEPSWRASHLKQTLYPATGPDNGIDVLTETVYVIIIATRWRVIIGHRWRAIRWEPRDGGPRAPRRGTTERGLPRNGRYVRTRVFLLFNNGRYCISQN